MKISTELAEYTLSASRTLILAWLALTADHHSRLRCTNLMTA